MSCQGWWLFSIAVILFHLRSTFFFSLLGTGFSNSKLFYLLLSDLWTIQWVNPYAWASYLVWGPYGVLEAEHFSWPCTSHRTKSSPSGWGQLLGSVCPGCCRGRHTLPLLQAGGMQGICGPPMWVLAQCWAQGTGSLTGRQSLLPTAKCSACSALALELACVLPTQCMGSPHSCFSSHCPRWVCL